MRRIVVAGYGNPLRRDDGAGWRVAAEVARRWGERVTVLIGQQPLPEWAETLSQAELAFIVDAALQEGDTPRLRRLRSTRTEPALGAHGFGPEHLLGLTQAVYGRAPDAYLLLLPAERLDFGEDLSPRTARAARLALGLLDRHLAALT